MDSLPKTKYARAADGSHIAYQVTGAGPSDLLLLPLGLIPVDAAWEEPSLARFLHRLGSFARVIRLDFVGVGLSDPASGPPTLERWCEDALTVLDAVGSAHAAVLAMNESGLVALLLAATQPDRVASLVLVNSFARVVGAPDYPIGVDPSEFDDAIEGFVDPDDATGYDYLTVGVPSVAHDSSFRDWWDRAGNRGAGPGMARAYLRVTMGSDVRAVLPAISVPTLVVHRVDDMALPVAHGRYLADRIADAKLVELPGGDDLMWVGDADTLLDEVEEFLTGVRRGPQSDSVLATVLYTDIVDSTKQASVLGDRAWTERLDAHDAMVRRQLERFRGREVKTLGDGFLAVFDGPARAIQCGCAVRDGAQQLGIDVRVGLHTGEVELRGTDIAGTTVNIGARVVALAAAGEVLVSRTVTDLVVGSGIAFDDREEHELKGVPGTWRLFAVAD
ncbi:MAG TPA: adenylate/guanylate cyclase domain-containing protein [Mycobacteriales bacterium]|nr:adenylate/guanylate cyclase domain-containing protein [Mycobacteriales bacterium]